MLLMNEQQVLSLALPGLREGARAKAASDQSQVMSLSKDSLTLVPDGTKAPALLRNDGFGRGNGSDTQGTHRVQWLSHCHAQSSSFIISPCKVPSFPTIRCCKLLILILIVINIYKLLCCLLVGRLDSCSALPQCCP